MTYLTDMTANTQTRAGRDRKEQLRAEVEVKAWHETAGSIAVRMEGAAYVGEQRVAQATVTCQLVDQARGRGRRKNGAEAASEDEKPQG